MWRGLSVCCLPRLIGAPRTAVADLDAPKSVLVIELRSKLNCHLIWIVTVFAPQLMSNGPLGEVLGSWRFS
jgi:hypothetical protein